jgi:hypothetical protein
MKRGGGNTSFSKTMGKAQLATKIRNAMNKQGEIRMIRLEGITNESKKTPRRFIIKRSQERNNNPTNLKPNAQ